MDHKQPSADRLGWQGPDVGTHAKSLNKLGHETALSTLTAYSPQGRCTPDTSSGSAIRRMGVLASTPAMNSLLDVKCSTSGVFVYLQPCLGSHHKCKLHPPGWPARMGTSLKAECRMHHLTHRCAETGSTGATGKTVEADTAGTVGSPGARGPMRTDLVSAELACTLGHGTHQGLTLLILMPALAHSHARFFVSWSMEAANTGRRSVQLVL